MEDMRETWITANSSDPEPQTRKPSAEESHIHFYICLAPRFTQKTVIQERIVAERIHSTDLEERRRKVGM